MQAVHLHLFDALHHLCRHREPSHSPARRHPLGTATRAPFLRILTSAKLTSLLALQIVLKVMTAGFLLSFVAQVTTMVFALIDILREFPRRLS